MTEAEIREYVGEVLIAGFDAVAMNDHAEKLIGHHKVRNIILFTRNVASLEQVRDLCAQMQTRAQETGYAHPLIICTDQENGIVRRVAPGLPGLPGNMAMGATQRADSVHTVGKATAQHLQSVGINMNLSPSLDVNNNPDNPVIGVRSYGESPQLVAELGSAMIRGLQGGGVSACAKHFPGHGDTATDSHLALPVVEHGRERLEAIELRPFRRAIADGVDVIMTAHVVFSSVDPDVSATLSKKVLTDFLRREMGYAGVITTDCLEMNAISQTIGVGEGAVQALLAGADLIMVSHELERQEAAIESLVTGVLEGRIPEERLVNAVTRIRRLRETRLAGNRVNTVDFSQLAREATRLQEELCPQALTLVHNESARLPLSKQSLKRVLVLMDATVPHNSAADPIHPRNILMEPLGEVLPDSHLSLWVVEPTGEPLDTSSAENQDLIVIGLNGTKNQRYIAFIRELTTQNLPVPVVVIALQSPYDLSVVPQAKTAMAMYECTSWMAKAAIQALFGGEAGGTLPVTIVEETIRG